MHTPMRPSARGHGVVFFFLRLLVSFCLLLRPAGSASTLSTFAMAKVASTTIVCGLLPSAASPLLVDLNCTAAGGDHERQETYPSSHPFSALAGGDDFLCAVGPAPALAGAVAMRWWDLSRNHTGGEGKNGTAASKRVYLGPPLRALSSGGYRVCGVLTGGELHCWRWRGLVIPAGLRFVAVAVGDGFVCAIARGPPTPIRCFDNGTEMEAVAGAPAGGSYDVVAARGHRACALSTAGGLSCWGRGGALLAGENATAGYAALALGEAGVCGLRTNGTIRCFGDGVAAPPASLAGLQYIDVQAQGAAFCGVLMANYSLVCWGGREFNATNRLVFHRVLPGPCVPMSSCQCGVLPGSANLCAGGRCICVDCAFELNVAVSRAPAIPGKSSSSRRRTTRTIWIAVGAAAAFLVLLLALQSALLLWGRRRRRRRRKDGRDELGVGQSLMPPRLGSSKGPGSVVEHFTLEALQAATDGFADGRRIGSGSFGSVYRGALADGREVAIKRAEEQAASRSSGSAAARPGDGVQLGADGAGARQPQEHRVPARLLRRLRRARAGVRVHGERHPPRPAPQPEPHGAAGVVVARPPRHRARRRAGDRVHARLRCAADHPPGRQVGEHPARRRVDGEDRRLRALLNAGARLRRRRRRRRRRQAAVHRRHGGVHGPGVLPAAAPDRQERRVQLRGGAPGAHVRLPRRAALRRERDPQERRRIRGAAHRRRRGRPGARPAPPGPDAVRARRARLRRLRPPLHDRGRRRPRARRRRLHGGAALPLPLRHRHRPPRPLPLHDGSL